MANKQDIADSIQALANTYQHMVEAAEVLRSLGSLENATAEAQAAKLAAEQARDKALAELAVVAADNEALRTQGELFVKDTRERCKTHLDAAQAKADKLLADAAAEAVKVEDAARLRAGAITADTGAQLATLEGLVLEARATLETLGEEYLAKELAVLELEKRAAKAQATVDRLLGK